MIWARRLKRVFDIETCEACGGDVALRHMGSNVQWRMVVESTKER